MKQNVISKLSLMVLCLIAISFLNSITSKSMESLYYSNSETFEDKEAKPKTSNKKATTNSDSNNNNKNNSPLKDLKQTTKFKKANNNVYLRTTNFYIRILKKLQDNRAPRQISLEILNKCKNLNIFEEMRESIMNCRVIQRKLDKKNKEVIKDFRVGCMKNILNIIRDKCFSIIKNSPGDKKYKTAIDILNNIPKTKQRKIRILAKKFIRRFAFSLRVFGKDVTDRIAEIKKIEEEQEKQRKQKLKELMEKERQKRLQRNKNKGRGKSKSKGNKNKDAAKRKKSFLELNIKEILQKESNQIEKNLNNNSNNVDTEQAKKKKNKEGKINKKENKKEAKKNSKNKEEQLKFPPNSKADKMFVEKVELTKTKTIVLSTLVVRAINKIVNF